MEEIVCLGDVVQGGTEPAQTLDRLAALGCETVLGNADAALLEVPADSPEPITERSSRCVTGRSPSSTPRTLEQIRSFVPVVRRELEDMSLLLFHGSPRSYDDVLLPELGDEALEPFLGHGAALLAGGHTHLQWTRRIGDALYVNPGSVGISLRPARGPAGPASARRVGARHRRRRRGRRRIPPGALRGRGRPDAAKRSGRPYADEWAAQWPATPRP